MTRVYLVRHGPTHQKNFVGWRDVPADLSDTSTIERLNAYLPKDATIISSDLSRAITTADAITGQRQRLAHEPQFREFNFGRWDGLNFKQVSETDPMLSRKFWEQPGDIAAPDGESWNAVADRVDRAIDKLMTDHKSLIIVAHFGVIMTQIARAERKGAYAAMSYEIDNFSVTETHWDGNRWNIGKINHKP